MCERRKTRIDKRKYEHAINVFINTIVSTKFIFIKRKKRRKVFTSIGKMCCRVKDSVEDNGSYSK